MTYCRTSIIDQKEATCATHVTATITGRKVGHVTRSRVSVCVKGTSWGAGVISARASTLIYHSTRKTRAA